MRAAQCIPAEYLPSANQMPADRRVAGMDRARLACWQIPPRLSGTYIGRAPTADWHRTTQAGFRTTSATADEPRDAR